MTMNINTNIIFLLIGLVSFNACSQGTQNAPYQLSDISYTDTLKGVWIKGYIVGGMKKSRDMIKSTEDIQWGVSGVNPDYLIMASNHNETDIQKCLLVDLSDSDLGIYKALNLADNPANLYQQIRCYGFPSPNLYGMNGFKFISDVTLQKKNIEHLDIANPFNLPFDKMPADNLLCDFEGISRIEELPDWKSKTLVGSTHWEIEKKDEDSKATITIEGEPTGHIVETWLITPLLKINPNSEFTFDCFAENYISTITLAIYFINEADGKTIFTEIPVDRIPAASKGQKNIEVNLTAFAGKTGFIGFKFTGFPDRKKSAYKIDNIKLTNKREILFLESFGNTPIKHPQRINNFTGYDNPKVFQAKNNHADIRYPKRFYLKSNVMYCVLGYRDKPYSDEITMNVSHIIPDTGYKNLTLSFDAGTTEDRYGTPLNKISIKCDGIPLYINPKWTLAGSIFKKFSLDIPAKTINQVSFSYSDNLNINIAIDNIMIKGEREN